MTDLDYEAFADILPAPKKLKRAPRATFTLRLAYRGGSCEEEGTKRYLLRKFACEVRRAESSDNEGYPVLRIEVERCDGTYEGSRLLAEWNRDEA